VTRARSLVRPDPRRDLRAIFAEGVAYAVMVGVGETYVPAFVLALGMGEVASGLVVTVPLVAGGLLQLAAPAGVRRVGSPRTWAIVGGAIQAAAFLPLVVGAALGRLPGLVVFAAATVYWGAGMAIGPAWNVWVERLVPPQVRARYFARRSSFAQLGVLAGLLAGGLVLQEASERGVELWGFALIFGIAAMARFHSIRYFLAQSDVQPGSFAVRGFPAVDLLRRAPRTAGARLLTYMLVLMATVMVAGPFFSAYMLRQLALPYWTYMAITGAALAAKVLALPFLGRLARRFGLLALLRLSWLGIAPMSALWLVSDRVEYLIALQILSGAAWAAHEYATFLLLFDTIGAERRTTVLTAFNLGNALAHVLGSVAGGWVFEGVGRGLAGYRALFALSSIGRAACLLLLLRVADGRVPSARPAFRLISVGPAFGVVLRPVLATIRPRRRARRREGEAAPSETGDAR
jgi:MFS family permease